MGKLITGIAILALACAALSACGFNHGAGITTSTTTSLVDSADKTTAKKLVLTSADLPPTWVASPSEPSSRNVASGVYDQLGSCTGAADVSQTRTVLYSGDTFANNDNAISSGVSGFNSPSVVTTEVAGIQNRANYPCITTLLNTILGRSLSSNESEGNQPQSTLSSIDGLTVASNQFDLRVTAKVADTNAYIDLIGVGHGRFVTTASVSYIGSVPPLELEQSILKALTNHAASSS